MDAVEAAREEALGTDVRVPPLQLTQCDRQTIESALFAPQAGFGDFEKYPTLAAKTAALLYALAKSQACADGNKRIALILVMEFLSLNDVTLNVDSDAAADMILATAETNAAEREAVVEHLTEELENVIGPFDPEEEP